MRLGEAVVREGAHLHVDLVGHLPGDAALGHPAVEAFTEAFHANRRSFRSHRLTKFIRLGGGEPSDVDRHLHELFLEERHPERLREGVLEQGMQVGDRLEPVAATDIRVHRAALDRPGSNEGHLDHQVIEPSRLQPRQGRHLGPRLDLEHPDGVRPAEHRVNLVLLGDGGEVDLVAAVLSDEVDREMQG